MVGMDASQLLVAVGEGRVWIKPVGRATFKIAPALKRFCMSVISKGTREIFFDMSDCSTMDSTFMGVIAGIAIWPVDEGEETVRTVLVHLTPRVHGMLSSLGLERIVTCYDEGETPPDIPADMDSEMEAVSETGDGGAAEQESERLHTMKQAHMDLVHADAANEARFCDVLTYLDDEIKRMDD